MKRLLLVCAALCSMGVMYANSKPFQSLSARQLTSIRTKPMPGHLPGSDPPPKIKSTSRVGRANILNQYYLKAYGNPDVGLLYYVMQAYNLFR